MPATRHRSRQPPAPRFPGKVNRAESFAKTIHAVCSCRLRFRRRSSGYRWRFRCWLAVIGSGPPVTRIGPDNRAEATSCSMWNQLGLRLPHSDAQSARRFDERRPDASIKGRICLGIEYRETKRHSRMTASSIVLPPGVGSGTIALPESESHSEDDSVQRT